MEDAHSIIVKLGNERESLDKKVIKLEKELAAAKGEILRLRTSMSSSGTVEKVHKNESENENAAVAVKKVRRRKKVESQQEES
ncbi:hypothetical protein CTI12_AA365630 [Artemisia annua]|uniref:Uncharacterized protein n=1 Tax=Artemisia annua TaxID=35608 RepID=A0A2U1MLX2_ARTAN|nr:hypothetical protein CTI12_AA365630 [Artemisia annua]